MKSNPEELLKKNPSLIHTDNQKVASHTQRDKEGWIIHTIMLEGYDVPFKFKRRENYKSLKGTRVNLTYYPAKEQIAGLEFEYMKVVRIKRS